MASNVIEFLVTTVDKTSGKMGKIQRSITRLGRVAAGAIGAGSMALMGKSVIDAGIAMQGIEVAMKAALGTSEAAAIEFNFVANEAERLGNNLQVSARSYTKLSAASRGTGVTQSEVRDIFIGISEAARVMNLNVEDTRGAFRALEQVMSKGTVQAEEIRGQLGERIPGAFNILADALDTNVEGLNKMLELGQVLAKDALPKMARELRRRFGQEVPAASRTAIANFNRMENAIFFLRVVIFKDLLPVLTSLVKFLTTAIPKAANFVSRAFAFMALSIQLAMVSILDAMQFLNDGLKEVNNKGIQEFFESWEARFKNISKTSGEQARIITSVTTKMGEVVAGTIGQMFISAEVNTARIAEKQEDLLQKIAKNWEIVNAEGNRFVLTLKDVEEALANIDNVRADDANAVISGLFKNLQNLREQFDAFSRGGPEGLVLAETFQQAAKLMDKFKDKISLSKEELVLLLLEIKNMEDAMESAQETVEDWAAKATQAFEASRTPLELYNARIAELGRLLKQGMIDQQVFFRQATQAWEDLGDATAAAMSSSSKFVDQAARNMQDAFADFFFDPFKDGLKGMVRSFANALRRMVAEALAAKLLESIFKRDTKTGKATGFLGSFLSFILPGFAHGGSFKVAGSGGTDSSVVAFRATPGETVAVGRGGRVPGKDMVGSGNVVVLNQVNNIDARGTDAQRIIQIIPPLLEENKNATINEMADLLERGVIRARTI